MLYLRYAEISLTSLTDWSRKFPLRGAYLAIRIN
jgi:hypothetical protein